MVVHVAWVITGAGHFLAETFEVMNRLTEKGDVKVTTFLSSAGVQVVKLYGLWGKLDKISPGGYLQEVFTDEKDDPGCSHAGRLVLGLYDVVVVSPASGNTVAKLVCGIADTLATNVVAQAQKGCVPVYVVPTDQKEGFVVTTLPHRIDQRKCKLCAPCLVVDTCPYSAVQVSGGVPRIVSGLCQGCGSCIDVCPFGAVKYGEEKKLRIRVVDVQNVKNLMLMDGLTVLGHPQQIEAIVEKH